MIGTLSVIEAWWLLISLVGLVYSYLVLRRSYADRRATREAVNGGTAARQLVADGVVFRARARFWVFVSWSLLGIGFGFFDLPEIPRLAGVLGLLGTAAVYAVTAIQESREQRALDELLASQEHLEIVKVLQQTADNTARIADNTEPPP